MTSLLATLQLYGEVLHREVSVPREQQTFTWQVPETVPFDELVISWNAKRPLQGEYVLTVKVKCDDWSEELAYAIWASDSQRTFTSVSQSQSVRTNEDTIELLNGAKAKGFCVTVEARNGATLEGFSCLHAAISDVAKTKAKSEEIIAFSGKESIFLNVPARSQMILNHVRSNSLCSPTSTSAVVSYLSGRDVPAIEFAEKVWDGGSDIYGNWIFNMAEGYDKLGDPWRLFVTRLESFEPVYAQLKRGIPSVVTVRGPIQGAPMPYDKGHLIAIIGYDAERKSIICMDPACASDGATIVRYEASDFLKAWCRRGQIVYLFEKR